MKRNLFVVFLLLFTLSSFAQFNGDGYYRVKNVGSGRYITVKDNRGSVNPATTSADMGAVELYKGFENVVSDPSSILYIDQTSSGYKFHAQGTDTYEIIGYYLNLSKNSDGSYKAYQGNSMMVMYLGDRVTSSAVKGSLSTNAKGTNRDWYILPFNASGSDNYFGLTPEVKAGNDYYASIYASFPFTTLSKNLKAYYICKVDRDMAVYKEVVDGKVPAATPVFVKCVSEKPADNRLDIATNGAAAISENKLGGVYFDNDNSAHYNRTAYKANTMRVLGTSADGKLAYVKADYEFLPANKSYLNVPSGSPDVIKLVTEAEYQKIIEEESKMFTITFKIGDKIISTQTLQVGATIDPPTAPVKEGYTFSGWGNVPATMPAKDLTIEGTYTVNTYTLTFKIGDEVISSESLVYGTVIEAPTAPTKEGYTFSGWGDVPATMPAKDLTIEGTYTVNTYTLTFKIGDEIISTASLAYGSAITAPAAPAKEGYTFSGWGDIPATMPAKDLTFEGSYTVNSYTLTFKIGDEVISTASLAYGSAITAPTAPTKEGYTFSGWGDIPATMPAKDLTFEGSYTVNSYTLTFKIGDEVISTKSLAYGAKIETPVVPTKTGYTFSGWSGVPETMPAENLIIEGAYVANNYTVTFNIDGKVFLVESIAYGSPISVPDAPEKEGYTFGGWGDVPATMPAENLVIEGSYNAIYYTVIFTIGEEIVSTDSVAYGSVITVPAAPVKDGYTFGGWGDIPATMPAEDLTFDGTYTINYYALTFMVDEEVILADSLAYGDSIEVPEVSEREGYNFSGWGDVPATMPARDLTIVGMYIEKDYYVVTFKVDDEIISMQSLAEGDSIYIPDAPKKEGHTFDGWGDVPATMPAQNLTFVGIYTAKNYTMTFEVGGQVIAKLTLPYGTPIEAPEVPEKEGHTFNGWDDVPATMPAFNWTCRGYYRVNSYTIQYKVDGKNYQKRTVQYGTSISLIADPKKEGRTFSGWSELPETMPAHNVEVVGSFMYYVYYYAEDALVHTEELFFGEEIPEYMYQPVDEVDTFLGWLGDTYATMPAHDVTYIASIEQSVEIITTDTLVDIYTMTGTKIMSRVSLDEAKAVLRRGIYIVNGKKMIIE